MCAEATRAGGRHMLRERDGYGEPIAVEEYEPRYETAPTCISSMARDTRGATRARFRNQRQRESPILPMLYSRLPQPATLPAARSEAR